MPEVIVRTSCEEAHGPSSAMQPVATPISVVLTMPPVSVIVEPAVNLSVPACSGVGFKLVTSDTDVPLRSPLNVPWKHAMPFVPVGHEGSGVNVKVPLTGLHCCAAATLLKASTALNAIRAAKAGTVRRGVCSVENVDSDACFIVCFTPLLSLCN